ncbi:membrane protein, partial [Xanthomonas vasicola pv. musacearum NCPPB 4384]
MQLSKIGWLQANGVSALTLAIVLGMLVGNTAYPRLSAKAGAGVRFSKANLLRLGIILYGLRLTFQDIGNVGWTGVAIDATVLCSTFGLACFLGVRVFGLDRNTAMLIGAGSSICGAAAVMATEPVVRGRAEQVMVAVATVVVFGTLAMFLYPALYHLIAHYRWFDLSPTEYGMFAGSTIHEVAQVVAAGRAGSEQAAHT